MKFGLLLLCVFSVSAYIDPIIEESLKIGRQLGGEICDDNVCCHISNTEDCSLNKMETGKSYMVYPDKATTGAQCIFGDPFGFQVLSGKNKDKLLFYFQGGG